MLLVDDHVELGILQAPRLWTHQAVLQAEEKMEVKKARSFVKRLAAEKDATQRRLQTNAAQAYRRHRAATLIQMVWKETRMRTLYGNLIERVRFHMRLEACKRRNNARWRWRSAVAAVAAQPHAPLPEDLLAMDEDQAEEDGDSLACAISGTAEASDKVCTQPACAKISRFGDTWF